MLKFKMFSYDFSPSNIKINNKEKSVASVSNFQANKLYLRALIESYHVNSGIAFFFESCRDTLPTLEKAVKKFKTLDKNLNFLQ